MRTRIVTLNLGGLRAEWFAQRRQVVIDGLRELRPDVVCFQETAIQRGPGRGYDQTLDLGHALGLRYSAFTAYGHAIQAMQPEQSGLGIVSHWPLRRVLNRKLPSGHDRPPDARVALFVALELPDGGELLVGTTHLSWRPDEAGVRLVQTGLVLEEIQRQGWLEPGRRGVLAADMNAHDGEDCVELASGQLVDVWRAAHPQAPGLTWVTSNPYTAEFSQMPDRRLDYLFSTPEARVASAELVLREPSPYFASDHFGVLADLEWPERKS